jgi:SAM-dependent methyltransferase
MANWFESPVGELVLERESELLAQHVRRFHGDTLLWLGPAASQRCDLARCMVRSRFFGVPPGCDPESLRTVTDRPFYVGEVGALPFRTAYMDAVVVHHGLDQSRDPRAAIREVARVVSPGGWLLICGFNPYSSFGVRHLASRLGRGDLGRLKLISPMRVLDWLAVLDFSVDNSSTHFIYGRPSDTDRRAQATLRRIGRGFESLRVPFGAVYVIMARKRAVRLVGAHGLERARPRFSLIPMPNPAASPRARTRAR